MKKTQEVKTIKPFPMIMVGCLLIISINSIAQAPIYKMWKTVFYLSSIYNNNIKSDTLTGTAFLISDSNKVYLVTAKHLVSASLLAANQKLINNEIFISTSTKIDDIGLPFNHIGKTHNSLKPYILSSDKDDIAIISLQKNEYKKLLTSILNMGYNPIRINSFELGDPLSFNNITSHHSWFTFISKSGHKKRMQGIFTDTINSVDKKRSSMQVSTFYQQGNDGSPLFSKDNKLIGMIVNGDLYLSTNDIIKNPYKTGHRARVVESSRILLLLKKLQKNELKYFDR